MALADDMCKLRMGPSNMHFTGYQPDSTRNKEFCEDIPATRACRPWCSIIWKMPSARRRLRSGHQGHGSEQDLQAITVLHLPPKVYPCAPRVNFEYNFDQPGKFVGLVTVRRNNIC